MGDFEEVAMSAPTWTWRLLFHKMQDFVKGTLKVL